MEKHPLSPRKMRKRPLDAEGDHAHPVHAHDASNTSNTNSQTQQTQVTESHESMFQFLFESLKNIIFKKIIFVYVR